MFIDASAIVAILLEEAGHEQLLDAIETTSEPLRVSPCVRVETTLALARARSLRAPQTASGVRLCAEVVERFLATVGAVESNLTPAIGGAAIEAAARFGKIVGHEAKLNFGDCLAYGCAKTNDESLLFVGADFIHTDIDRVR